MQKAGPVLLLGMLALALIVAGSPAAQAQTNSCGISPDEFGHKDPEMRQRSASGLCAEVTAKAVGLAVSQHCRNYISRIASSELEYLARNPGRFAPLHASVQSRFTADPELACNLAYDLYGPTGRVKPGLIVRAAPRGGFLGEYDQVRPTPRSP